MDCEFMGKKEKKKKASASQQKILNAQEDNVFNTIEWDDDCVGRLEDIDVITRFLLYTNKQLGKVANEFLETFKNRCQLSIGKALVHLFEILCFVDRPPAEGKSPLPVVLSPHRILLLYLIYRVRELEPWLKRKAEKNKENIQGHIFLELFLHVAKNIPETSDDGTEIVYPNLSPGEKRLARLILSQQGGTIQNLTAAEIYNRTQKELIPDSMNYAQVAALYEQQRQYWPAIEKPCSSKVSPNAFLLHSVIPSELHSQEEIFNDDLVLSTFTLLGIDMDNWEEECVSTSKREGTEVPEQPPESSFSATLLQEQNKEIYRTGKKSVVEEIHDEIEVDGQPTPVVKLVRVEVADQVVPEYSAKSASKISSISHLVPKLLKGEQLTQVEMNEVFRYIHRPNCEDGFFIEMDEFPSKHICLYIETNVRFASELVFQIVQKSPAKLSTFMESMTEMGFSVQCVEIVLRLYRHIPGLPSDTLLEYFNALMNICNQTTSSSQKARYVRMFSSFVITILNDGILSRGLDSNIKNSLQQIQAFALHNNEHREATALYQRIQEVLRKLSS